MKRFREFLRTPAVTVLLFIAAIGLLGFSSINGARAAISVFSETYRADIEMQHIGVTLQESTTTGDPKRVAWRDYTGSNTWDTGSVPLLEHLKEENVQFNKPYDEILTVRNSGTIDEYVRVILYTYWLDENGRKMLNTPFTPDLIQLNYVNNNLWVEDQSVRTSERKIFYYQNTLAPGQTSVPLTDTIRISDAAGGKVTYSNDGSLAYRYKGKTFMVEAEVDAVQIHHAGDAKTSAWGVNK